jgi:hypothetical protein
MLAGASCVSPQTAALLTFPRPQVQGPFASTLSAPEMLQIYSECNNTGTQAFDTAYDKFTDYIIANATTIVARRVVDFEDIFGSDFETKEDKLYKVARKAVRLPARVAGHAVPPDLWRLNSCR